jgi:hypothetical protein
MELFNLAGTTLSTRKNFESINMYTHTHYGISEMDTQLLPENLKEKYYLGDKSRDLLLLLLLVGRWPVYFSASLHLFIG